MDLPNPSDFLSSFLTAVSTPVTRPVTWPDSIPKDHPVRNLGLCTRYWPPGVASFIQSRADSKEADWLKGLYWYLIAATICKADGTVAFCDRWPELWRNYVDAIDTRIVQAAASPVTVPPHPDLDLVPAGKYNEQNELVIPPIDYHVVGEWLKSQYDTPNGLALMHPMWKASLDYNGWVPTEAKNSERTDTSVPSGEKQDVGAAQ